MNINREFGKRLHKLRVGNRLTLEELAQKTGLSRNYLQILESTHPKSPTLDTIKKIADAFNMQVWQMLMP